MYRLPRSVGRAPGGGRGPLLGGARSVLLLLWRRWRVGVGGPVAGPVAARCARGGGVLYVPTPFGRSQPFGTFRCL